MPGPAHHLRTLLLALAGSSVVAARVEAGPSYALTDLGTGILPTGIGASGQIFGTASGQPYLYNDGQKWPLVGAPAGSNVVALAAGGLATGNLSDGHAYLDNNGVVSDLGTLGGLVSNASGLNASGVVVGNAQDGTGNYLAFLDDGTMHALGTLGGASSYAAGINASGQVVGGAQDASGNQKAFIYQNGQITSLGTLGGATSGAAAINAAGQVAGTSKLASGLSHAFLVTGGQMLDLGSLGNASYGFGLNASGEVVGTAYIPGPKGTFTNHAFLATAGGGMLDLNNLVAGMPSGWLLTTATGVADDGEVVGFGYVNGVPHGYLLTPIATPEPTTLVLLGVGAFAGLVGRGARRVLRSDLARRT